MSIKGLITSDLHFTDNPRDSYRFIRFEEILEKAFTLYPDINTLFILGDLTEKKNNHSDILVNSIVNLLCKIVKNYGIEIHILKGNHDVAGHIPYFNFLNHIPKIYFYKDVVKWMAENIWMVPHQRDSWLDEETVQEINKQDQSVVFCHQTFSGFRYENGIVAEGMALPQFDKRHLIVSGDLHVPQGIYVGSPWHVDFADSFVPRVQVMYKNKDNMYVLADIDLGEYCDKFQVEITSLKDLSRLKSIKENSVVKIKLNIPQEELSGLNILQEQIRELSAKNNFLLHTVEVVVQQTPEKAVKKKREKEISDVDLIKHHVREKGLGQEMEDMGIAIIG